MEKEIIIIKPSKLITLNDILHFSVRAYLSIIRPGSGISGVCCGSLFIWRSSSVHRMFYCNEMFSVLQGKSEEVRCFRPFYGICPSNP